MLEFFYIAIYWILLIFFYFLIAWRLKTLSKWHVENTWVAALWKWYKIVRWRIILALIVLFFLWSLVILTFMDNGLLYKGWLHNNQEALDNNGL